MSDLDRLEHTLIAEEVAAKMAHDLRNRLASIQNAAYFIKRKTQRTELWEGSRLPRFFDLISSQVAEYRQRLPGIEVLASPDRVAAIEAHLPRHPKTDCIFFSRLASDASRNENSCSVQVRAHA